MTLDIIADASSLIVLARLDGLWLLDRMFARTTLTSAVEVETVHQGKARGYGDAVRIEAAIHARKLFVITPTDVEERRAHAMTKVAPALSLSDCLTLACAKERRATLLIEDRRARNVAASEGIDYVTLQVLPLHGFIADRLRFDDCDDWLGRIGRAMHTDQAVVGVLQAAAREIARLRDEETKP